MERLLLHTCCAPCSIHCVESLRKEGIEPVSFWYNPNIHPYQEYKARRDALIAYASSIELNLVIKEDYGLRNFVRAVAVNQPAEFVVKFFVKKPPQVVQFAQNGPCAVVVLHGAPVHGGQNLALIHNWRKALAHHIFKAINVVQGIGQGGTCKDLHHLAHS